MIQPISRLTLRDEVKFVIGSRADYDYAKALLAKLPGGFKINNIHFSPLYGIMTPVMLAGWMLEDGVHARLSLQLHKQIWPDTLRGV